MGTTMTNVAPSNAEQAAAWNGDQGQFWTEQADYFDDGVAGYREPFIAACSLNEGMHVLDIGCGTGQTTREAARAATRGTALGVDLSSSMIELARRTAQDEGLTNCSFEQLDAQVHPFRPKWELVMSRSGVMFFGEPDVAFANLARALKPEGRIVLFVWRAFGENEWICEVSGALSAGRELPMPPADAPGPFSLADPGRVRALLEGAGFEDVSLTPLERPMRFGRTPEDARDFILGLSGWMLDGLDDVSRARAIDKLNSTIDSHAGTTGVHFGSAGWIVSGLRRL